MLTYETPPQPQALRNATANALADFRVRYERREEEEVRRAPFPVIREVFPRFVIPRGSRWYSTSLAGVLEQGGRWHVQIHHPEDEPGRRLRYCRIRWDGESWHPSWFGYRWAWPVDRGVAWLKDHETRFDSRVVLVSSSLFKFTTFWLRDLDLHRVASSPGFLGEEGRMLGGGELQKILVREFGTGYAGGGVG